MADFNAKVLYEFDQDPRYGWVDIETDQEELLLVIRDREGKSYGFSFSDGQMEATCICYAWNSSECSCLNLPFDYWEI